MEMDNKFENMDTIIAKVLCNEASAEERQMLKEWRQLDKANEEEFAAMQSVMMETEKLKPELSVNIDKAWSNVQSKIKRQKQGKIVPLRFLRYAAMLAIVAGISFLTYRLLLNKPQESIQLTAFNAIKTSNLPDGSTVTINKGSSLTYLKNTYHSKRELQLNGEAYFDVKHNNEVPFIVRVGELHIEDIGTSFNVKTLADKNVQVTVMTGLVMMYDSVDTLNLHEGETAVYNVVNGTLSKITGADKNEAAYATKHLVFENTGLLDVVKLLNDVYGTNIEIADSALKNCRLTSSFKNENPDDIVAVISEALQLKVEHRDNQILLKGEGCK